MPSRALRTEKLDLRLSAATKRTLQIAASIANRSLTDFVVESALSRADETLADRRAFVLSKAKWSEFQAALDAPTRPLPHMQRLLTEPGFFDSDSATTKEIR